MRQPDPLSIAIVGIGCLFPQSADLQSYWRNILARRDCISDVPDDHSWSVSDYYDPDHTAPDKTWVTRGGFLDKVPFDPMAYGIPPLMLESIDTSQLLGLVVAREALRDAGLDPDADDWDRDRVSCILGITGTQEMAITAGARLQGPIWRKSMLRCGVDPALADVVVKDIANHFPTWTEQTFPGLLGNVVSGRIANRLDLGGANAVVDAACASSLAAMQYAVSQLVSGACDVALTGGVDTLNDIFMFECFTRTPAFSATGDARPFDASADGILIGEGLAICAFKRLADAERDGDRIYAVIRGLSASSDGRHRSIYAPNPVGQAKALRRAYAQAGVSPGTIELVEAHGTGTKAGDVAEVTALSEVFSDAERDGQWCALGTVKSQIGHTKSTAGAAGLVKIALALHQRVLPPTAKIDRPNPKMGFEDSALYLSDRSRPWIRAADHPRRAAVSAFGFGGSNYHALLEEHGATEVAALSAAPTELFLVGADSPDALAQALDALGGATVTHAARAALAAWTPGEAHVAAFLARSLDELGQRVDTCKERLGGASPSPRDEVWIGRGDAAPKVAWLFPGQGSQYVEMGRTVAVRHPAVRAAFDQAEEAFRSRGWPSLAQTVFPPPAWTPEHTEAQQRDLRATEWAQPAIGALSTGLASLLDAFGVTPDVVAGHSYGELAALCAAGALDADGLMAASRIRGQLMAGDGGDRGTMAAIDGPLEGIRAVLADHPDVVLANRNHPQQGVISGPTEAVQAACSQLDREGLRSKPLTVSAAFHSPLVAEAEQPFREALDELTLRAPQLEVLSCTTAQPYPDGAEAVRDQLASQIVQPVDWVGVVEALVARDVTVFVECGPRGVLCGLTEACLDGRLATVVGLDRRGHKEHGDTQLKRVLAQLAAAGVPIDPAPLLAERAPVDPPTAGGPATVWLAGANHREPTTLEPPMPKLPSDGWGAVPSTGAPMDKPVHLEHAEPEPPAVLPEASLQASPTSAAMDGGQLAQLLESTRQTLQAFQRTQEKTAEVHSQFLDAFARANDNFARLFEAQTQLVQHVASGGTVPTPSLTTPSLPEAPSVPTPLELPVAPQPVAAAPEAPTPELLDLGRVVTSSATTQVASDLPPLLDAAAAVQASRSTAPAATAVAPTPTGPPLSDAVLTAVATKTGYPREALELSMDLESDLGIDSIKRVEILSAVRDERPDLPELDSERLSGLRTLADVVEELAKATGGAAAAAVVPAVLQVPEQPSRERMEQAVLGAVAAKTGYPLAALELSMDLESDLGVDSIKRVEILSAVRDEMPDLPELDNEAMATLRTLADVVDHLASQAAGLGFALIGSGAEGGQPALLVPPEAPSPPPATEASLPPVRSVSELASPPPADLRRAEVVVVDAPQGAPLPARGPWLVTRDVEGTLAREVVRILSERGCEVTMVDPDWSSERAVAKAVPEGLSGVVHLAAVGTTDAEGAARRVRGAFWVARATGPVPRFVVASARGGQFGRTSSTAPAEAGALSGLAKTLLAEWPDTQPLALDLGDGVDASTVVDEVLTDRRTAEVGLTTEGVHTLVTSPLQAAPPAAPDVPPLAVGDLVVATGGARGVTAACVRALARRVPVALLLLGRTPLSEAEPEWAEGVDDGELIAAYLKHEDDASPKRATTEASRVLADREIRSTLEALGTTGVAAHYASVDVRDASSVAAAVDAAVAEHGPVRGVIHGAGVLADKEIAKKSTEQFDRVWSTKVDGLSAVLDACNPDELRVVGLFSSIAGREGNAGQVDYAMANEAIVQRALDLQRQAKDALVRALDWGPWDGGMVTEGLKAHFAAQGRTVIDLSAGAEACVDELGRSGAVEVVVDGARPATGRQVRPLTPEAPWLADHRIGERCVVPAVMVLEWMTSVARDVAPSLRVGSVRDLQVLKGVVLEPGVTQVALSWEPVVPREGRHALCFELRIPGDASDRLHYRAVVELEEPGTLDPPDHEANGLAADPYPYAVDEAYQRFLFHGPALRGIDEVMGISDHGAMAWLHTSRPVRLGVSGDHWATDPVTLDSALQLMVLWVREKHGSAALPCAMGEYRQFGPLPAKRVCCHLEMEPDTSERRGRFTITLVDDEGSVVARLSRGEYTGERSLIPSFQYARSEATTTTNS